MNWIIWISVAFTIINVHILTKIYMRLIHLEKCFDILRDIVDEIKQIKKR